MSAKSTSPQRGQTLVGMSSSRSCVPANTYLVPPCCRACVLLSLACMAVVLPSHAEQLAPCEPWAAHMRSLERYLCLSVLEQSSRRNGSPRLEHVSIRSHKGHVKAISHAKRMDRGAAHQRYRIGIASRSQQATEPLERFVEHGKPQLSPMYETSAHHKRSTHSHHHSRTKPVDRQRPLMREHERRTHRYACNHKRARPWSIPQRAGIGGKQR